MIRAVIISATIAALICMYLDKPPVPKSADYCPIDMKLAGKDEFGVWHVFLGKGYGPCRLMDRYEIA